MNQYVSIFTPDVIPIRGCADADAKVAVTTTVGGTSATYMPERSGQDFSIDIPVDNSSGPVTAHVTVDALKHDGTLDIDLHRRLSGDYTVPAATPEVPSYVADGNMLSHDGWACAWNAQDRLVSATKGTTRLELNYDYLGRRFEKKVYESNVLTKHQLFVYDGFKQIAEYDALDSNNLSNTYLWHPVGLDVPLLRNGSEFFVSDANKNIVALIDTTGSVTDTYIYDPFGNCTHSGTSANPFRFSSEYFDEETGLVYYNYRYYSPELGRWLSRDPMEEKESINLYLIGNNCTFNSWDYLGLKNYASGNSDPPVTRDVGAGQWNSEKATLRMKSLRFLLLHCPVSYFLPDAWAHLKHYLGNSGSKYTIRFAKMISDVKTVKDLQKKELDEAMKYVEEKLRDGSHSITSLATSGGYVSQAENPNCFFAVGGYSVWGKGTAKVTGNSNCFELDFDFKFFDWYNWDNGKSVWIAGQEITNEFMGTFHRQGPAKEFDMVGSVSLHVKWKRGERMKEIYKLFNNWRRR